MVIFKSILRLVWLLSVITCIICSGCKTSKQPVTTNAYRIPKTECVMNTANDKVLLEVWAKGLNKSQAIIAAKKKAVEEISFTGIHAGETSGVSYPLIDNPITRELNSKFFNDFFSDKGRFNDFVREADKNYTETVQGDGFVLCRTRLIVDMADLLEYYKKKHVIE